MLDHASQSASNQNPIPTPPTEPEQNSHTDNRDYLTPADVDTDHDNGDNDEEDPDYKVRIAPGNNNRRITRATRDPSTPHCSLLIQTLKYCASQAAKARLS